MPGTAGAAKQASPQIAAHKPFISQHVCCGMSAQPAINVSCCQLYVWTLEEQHIPASSAPPFPATPSSSSQKAKQRSRKTTLGMDPAQAFTPQRKMAVLDRGAGSSDLACRSGLHRKPSTKLQPILQQRCNLFYAEYPHHP